MTEAIQLLAKAGVTFVGLVLGLALTLIAALGVMISVGGTGGFTNDPPPVKPDFLTAMAVVLVWLAFETLIYSTWKRLVQFIDEKAAGL